MQSKPWATPTKDVALQQLNQGMGVAIGKLLGNVLSSRLSRILVEIISSSFSNLHYLCSTKVRRMQKKFQFALLALILASVWGCSTDFEVYAPEKEIRSVYCVLNPRSDFQYVRVAKAYQVKGDAISYAGANDFSMKNLTVKLKAGNKTWTAIEVPNFPKESGIFLPTHTVYQFTTDGTSGHDTLAYDTEYTLEIGTPDADDYITGKTVVPPLPRIRGDLNIIYGSGNQKCLPRLFLDREYSFIWKTLAEPINYEVRVGFNFEANGVRDSVLWGPSSMFNSSSPKCSSQECSYKFGEKELLQDFARSMPELPNVNYTYDTQDSCAPESQLYLMPKSLWFEVTAVDQYLSNYLIVNDPAVTDLNTTKPEYTNLSGNMEAIGIFGSYTTDRRYAIMQACSEYLLGLNNRAQPVGCTWD